MKDCVHNQRTRYTHGFHCNDCDIFFAKDSPTYRSGELLSSIWAVLHNYNVEEFRAGREEIVEVAEMKGKIGIGIKHENYEDLIAQAEEIMSRHGIASDSATIVLRGK